ncbi:MAG: ATP-binding cassette domain-containing protein, partial [Acidimicrobiales bacterium]
MPPCLEKSRRRGEGSINAQVNVIRLFSHEREPEGCRVSTGPVLEARELVKRFGDLTAVKGVSFTIERGESFGFLGPNGAGKTST